MVDGAVMDDAGDPCALSMEEVMYHAIEYSLDHYLIANAMFIAERLHAESRSADTTRVLSHVYLRAGKPHRAYHLLQDACGSGVMIDRRSTFIFAQAAFDLTKYNDAECALLQPGMGLAYTPDDVAVCNDIHHRYSDGAGSWTLSDAAAAYHLLGLTCIHTCRSSQAIIYFKKCIELNPLVWTAYEHLCQLGCDAGASSVFSSSRLPHRDVVVALSGGDCPSEYQSTTITRQQALAQPYRPPPLPSHHEDSTPGVTPAPSPSMGYTDRSVASNSSFAIRTSITTPEFILNGRRRGRRGSEGGGDARSVAATPIEYGMEGGYGCRANPDASLHTPVTSFTCYTPSPLDNHPIPVPPAPTSLKHRKVAARPPPDPLLSADVSSPAARRSQRQRLTFASVEKDAAEREGGGRGMSMYGRSATSKGAISVMDDDDARPSRRSTAIPSTIHQPNPAHTNTTTSNVAQAGQLEDSIHDIARWHSPPSFSPAWTSVMDLFHVLGTAYHQLCMFECVEAVETLHQLPPHHVASAWVQMLFGRAYFELVDYQRAESYFKAARRADPMIVDGLVEYSTTLWHLRKESELCCLARQTVQDDRCSPHAWCVVGNCFSLRNEHDLALKFFRRATQLDPSFTYAYTLAGHEHAANENYEKALTCYRKALAINERHYKGWFGLGSIFHRQEQHELAIYHFERARQINPRNSVIYCCLGVVLCNRGRHDDGIPMLEMAITIDPKNLLARFKRAKYLERLSRHHEALSDLEELTSLAPTESEVFVLTARIYQKIGEPGLALINYNLALDLNPRNASYIRAQIDRLDGFPALMDDVDDAQTIDDNDGDDMRMAASSRH